MRYRTIPIKKSLIPYRFQIALPKEIYEIELLYNETADLFVMSLAKGGEILCAGEPLVYGKPMFADIYKQGQFPELRLVPLDESGRMERVTWDNLEATVFLTVEELNE